MHTQAAPVLSTPDTHIFEEPGPQVDIKSLPRLDNEQLLNTYEIQRTVDEIRAGRWKRVALQFPDHMLLDAPRVFQALSRGLKTARKSRSIFLGRRANGNATSSDMAHLSEKLGDASLSTQSVDEEEKLYILADTSYGACCVDEVAAEHADADVVVHYGRSCLSPTARLPVVYVFTKPPLDLDTVIQVFKGLYTDFDQKVILMADIPYVEYIPEIAARLETAGYIHVFETSVIHDTTSPLPNRTVPTELTTESQALSQYQLFHIAEPPPSLLLTLSSRLGAIHIYPISNPATSTPSPIHVSSLATLRRRYGLLTSLSTVPIFGILINTLSVKNYLHILKHVKDIIAAAGKKSYTFVVGKVNAAKVANFSEVGGWVVIGCWESSLFDSKDFWKPVITPFELELTLKGDAERIWTGQWSSDFQAILEAKHQENDINGSVIANSVEKEDVDGDLNSEEESEPPEFDLRTGRYVSHSRPMGSTTRRAATLNGQSTNKHFATTALIKRANGDLATIGGVVSPAAEFFREKRTWKGLGSDFEIAYDEEGNLEARKGAAVEQGRSGIARGYVVGDEVARR